MQNRMVIDLRLELTEEEAAALRRFAAYVARDRAANDADVPLSSWEPTVPEERLELRRALSEIAFFYGDHTRGSASRDEGLKAALTGVFE